MKASASRTGRRKPATSIKSLRSRFALVLSGTPLENRLDDLYSVVQFVDDRRLGPGFRFFNRHRMVDEKGKVLGYKNLAELRTACSRRSCCAARATASRWSCRRGPWSSFAFLPSEEQLELHAAHMQVVASITRKKFITEMDLLRLQKALLMCRMSADGTFLVNKEEPSYSTKLEELDESDRAAVRGRRPQGHHLLGVDDHAQHDRAAPDEARIRVTSGSTAAFPRRNGPNSSTPSRTIRIANSS